MDYDQWRVIKNNAIGEKETFLYKEWQGARIQIQALHALDVWYQVYAFHENEWKKLDMPWMYD